MQPLISRTVVRRRSQILLILHFTGLYKLRSDRLGIFEFLVCHSFAQHHLSIQHVYDVFEQLQNNEPWEQPNQGDFVKKNSDKKFIPKL